MNGQSGGLKKGQVFGAATEELGNFRIRSARNSIFRLLFLLVMMASLFSTADILL